MDLNSIFVFFDFLEKSLNSLFESIMFPKFSSQFIIQPDLRHHGDKLNEEEACSSTMEHHDNNLGKQVLWRPNMQGVGALGALGNGSPGAVIVAIVGALRGEERRGVGIPSALLGNKRFC